MLVIFNIHKRLQRYYFFLIPASKLPRIIFDEKILIILLLIYCKAVAENINLC